MKFKTKNAFTLIELILVVVILGIVSIMTLNMVLSIYKNYAQSESVARIMSQADLVLNQIGKRLDYRVKDSVIARSSSDMSFISVSDDSISSNYDVLEFIPYSVEAFNLGIYSGVVDMDESDSKKGLSSPTSKLSADVFSDLTNTKVKFSSTNGGVAMIFKGLSYNVATSFGYNKSSSVPLDIAKVGIKDKTTFNLDPTFIDKKISEQYYLAHTAYAIALTDNSTTTDAITTNRDYDLMLYYNYRPWLGETYKDGKSVLLAKNVSMFKFKGNNGMVLLKLCLRDNQKQRRAMLRSGNFDFTVCRTKAVY